jgi:hypothetical protein
MVDLRRLYVWMKAEERFVSVMGVGVHDFPEPIGRCRTTSWIGG